MRRVMRRVLCAFLLCVPLLLPVGVWSVQPLGAWAGHSTTWWYNHTPRCWGPVCVDVYHDHVAIEIDLRLPWAGGDS